MRLLIKRFRYFCESDRPEPQPNRPEQLIETYKHIFTINLYLISQAHHSHDLFTPCYKM